MICLSLSFKLVIAHKAKNIVSSKDHGKGFQDNWQYHHTVETPMIIIHPDMPPLDERKNKRQLYQNQSVQTIATI